MAIAGIPEAIHDFNLYVSGRKLLGHTGEVTLPNLESSTQEVTGAGILGEYDAPIIGRYGSIEQELTFRCVNLDFFSTMNPGVTTQITLRGAIQQVDASTGRVSYVGTRIIFGGRCKNINMGTAKQGESMNCTITMELTYYLVEMNGKPMVELDKLNSIYKLNGVDMLAGVRSLI